MGVRDDIEEATKICLGFQDPDRKVRKLVFQRLRDLCSQLELTDEDLRSIFNATYVHFLNGLRDKSEAVREEAVKFILFFIVDRLPLNDYYLSYVFPVFIERVGTPELVEPSEEVRLQIVDCLNEIIKKYSNSKCLLPFYNQFVTILCETLKDRCPEVQNASCETIISLETAIHSDFHLQAESFLKPALSCITHQRYKVRVAGVRALGVIVMHSTNKGVNEAIGPLGERLLDQNPQVRQAVCEAAGNWLLHHRDRYSYFGKMIPLLITGLTDEVKEIRNVCYDLWVLVGQKYEHENEKELKDASEFLPTIPVDYPKNIERPGLGCRALVCRHLNMMLGGLANEFNCWKEEVRFKCSQLLCTLVLHAERNLTQHLQGLLTIMFSAARDDDTRVVTNVIYASKFVGLFVRYQTWSKQLISVLEDEPHFGHLNVLSGILSGMRASDVDKAQLPISAILASDRVACSRKKKYQLALLNCVKVFFGDYKQTHPFVYMTIPKREVYYNLFKILTCLIALAHSENGDQISLQTYEDLEVDDGDGYSGDLYREILNHKPRLWTESSDEACIFITLLRRTSWLTLWKNIEVITAILKEIMSNDTDAMLKINVLREFAACLQNDSVLLDAMKLEFSTVMKSMKKLMEEVLAPSLQWHPGATAEAVRTIVITCMCSVLKPSGTLYNRVMLYDSKEETENLQRLQLTNLFISSMEDASHVTREMAIKCLMHLRYRFDLYRLNNLERFLTVHSALLRRLDDPIDAVRKSALQALTGEIKNCSDEFLEPNFKNHRLNIANVLLLHFDDNDESVSALAAEALTEIILCDASLIGKIEEQMPNLMHRKKCKLMLRAVKPLVPGGDFMLLMESSDEECEKTKETKNNEPDGK